MNGPRIGSLFGVKGNGTPICRCNHPPAWHDPAIGCIACGCHAYDPRPEARR